VVLEQQVRAAADADARLRIDAARLQAVELLEELLEVEDDAVAEQAALLGVQDARRDLVQDELLDAVAVGAPMCTVWPALAPPW
jgi:hypothetical protein